MKSNQSAATLLSVVRWRHLMFNAVAQLIVGVPLELMHGALRTAVVYVAGILAGIACL